MTSSANRVSHTHVRRHKNLLHIGQSHNHLRHIPRNCPALLSDILGELLPEASRNRHLWDVFGGSGDEVEPVVADSLCFVPELVAKEQNREERNREISSDE